MSAKKQKQMRKFMKKLSIELERNDDLYDEGFDWFDDEDYHDEWFEQACQMKVIDPTVDEKVLMPDMIPHLMFEVGMIKDDDIEKYLHRITPSKLQEVIEEIEYNF